MNDFGQIVGGALGVIVIIALVAVLIIGIPWVTIQAIEVLFPVEIPFNFWTWVSTVWLIAVLTTHTRRG